jgi:hypothetical protein
MRLDYLQRIDLGMGLVKQQHGNWHSHIGRGIP